MDFVFIMRYTAETIMAEGTVNITQERYDALARELETLKTAGRRGVAENLEYAKSLGDLSENAEYHEARAAQAELEDKIVRLERTLKNAVIEKSSAHRAHTKAEIGAKITLRREKDGAEISYMIVGAEEGDIANGKLSIESPLGRAMKGKEAGARLSVKTPNGESSYVIISVM